ncbi:MAG: hypothetical protein ACOCZL_03710 [Bacteroidota bacterium]
MGIPVAGEENFILIHYVKANDPEKYFEMERTAYMPLHQLAMDNKNRAGWSVWTPWLHDGNSTTLLLLWMDLPPLNK